MSRTQAPGRLAGRAIVVTRSTEQAGELSRLLAAEGATVVEVPLISVLDADDGGAALDRSLAGLRPGDWLIVTSPNGASRVATALGSRPLAARVAVVGQGTQAALGRPAELIPERQVAEGLLAELPDEPGRAVLVQSDLARPVLAEGLRERGWEVCSVVAYRNVAVSPTAAHRRALATADAVTLASGSAARSLMAATGGMGLPATVVSIGPVTTRVASDVGLRVTATAVEHSLGGLVEAVVGAVSR